MTLSLDNLDQVRGDPIKRFKSHNDDRFSLSRYRAGERWDMFNVMPFDYLVHVGNTLYATTQREIGTHALIQASDDYGMTWREYSQVPADIESCTTLYSQSENLIYLIGGQRKFPINRDMPRDSVRYNLTKVGLELRRVPEVYIS